MELLSPAAAVVVVVVVEGRKRTRNTLDLVVCHMFH
jgi:hypothetical protein